MPLSLPSDALVLPSDALVLPSDTLVLPSDALVLPLVPIHVPIDICISVMEDLFTQGKWPCPYKNKLPGLEHNTDSQYIIEASLSVPGRISWGFMDLYRRENRMPQHDNCIQKANQCKIVLQTIYYHCIEF